MVVVVVVVVVVMAIVVVVAGNKEDEEVQRRRSSSTISAHPEGLGPQTMKQRHNLTVQQLFAAGPGSLSNKSKPKLKPDPSQDVSVNPQHLFHHTSTRKTKLNGKKLRILLLQLQAVVS